MRSLFAVVALGIAFSPLMVPGDWEQVWPENYPSFEELPLLSVGTRPVENDQREVLIGSRSGYVLWGTYQEGDEPEGPKSLEIQKLPVPFDVRAVTSSGAGWIIGGTGGQVAASAENWTIHQLPTRDPVVGLAANADSAVAWAGDQIFSTLDGGESWSHIETLDGVQDLAILNDTFYLVRGNVSDDWMITLELLRSIDGQDWTSDWSWSLETQGYVPIEMRRARLAVLQESDAAGGLIGPGPRLYLDLWLLDRLEWNHRFFELRVSTTDGATWIDHGSLYEEIAYGEAIVRKILNPANIPGEYIDEADKWELLDIPEERIDGRDPGLDRGSVSGNFRVKDNTLFRYRGLGLDPAWRQILKSPDEIRIDPDTNTYWEDLNFVYDDRMLVSISKDKQITVEEPDFAIGDWDQLIRTKGVTYAKVINDRFEANYFSSPDMATWSPFEVTQNEWESSVNGWLMLQNGNIKYTYRSPDIVYLPETDTWYELAPRWSNTNFITINANRPGGWNRFLTVDPVSWNQNFIHFSSPDESALYAFGTSAEIVIVHPGRSWRTVNIWEWLPKGEHRVNVIRFINGWYYVVGSATVRTRDFEEFEPVKTPNDEELIDMVGYNGDLYAFTRGAVYRRPMERGYLDSITQKHGWLQSDWLGWFQVIDEATGRINHLLLGTFQIISTGPGQYWLRPPGLGWIHMYADWMPWFWRMEDGHWLWLDQDGWPPRAWDADAEAWIELSP